MKTAPWSVRGAKAGKGWLQRAGRIDPATPETCLFPVDYALSKNQARMSVTEGGAIGPTFGRSRKVETRRRCPWRTSERSGPRPSNPQLQIPRTAPAPSNTRHRRPPRALGSNPLSVMTGLVPVIHVVARNRAVRTASGIRPPSNPAQSSLTSPNASSRTRRETRSPASGASPPSSRPARSAASRSSCARSRTSRGRKCP